MRLNLKFSIAHRAFPFILTIALAVPLSLTAPAQAQSDRGIAGLVPANTYFYAEFDVESTLATADAIAERLSEAGLPVPTNVIAALDLLLEPQSGISIENDVLPWMGESFAFGISALDETIDQSILSVVAPQRAYEDNRNRNFAAAPSLRTFFIAEVKDEAAADAFVEKLLPAYTQMFPYTELQRIDATIDGKPAVLYSEQRNESGIEVGFARWEGYFAFGNLYELIDNLNGGGTFLADDPLFVNSTALLNADRIFTAFNRFGGVSNPYNAAILVFGVLGPTIGNVFSSIDLGVATPTPTPTPEPLLEEAAVLAALRNLSAAAYGARIEGNVLLLETATVMSEERARELAALSGVPVESLLTATPTPIDGTIAEVIPADAFAAFIGTDMPLLTAQVRELIGLYQTANAILEREPDNLSAIVANIAQGEDLLDAQLGFSPRNDVFSWANNEFGVYVPASAVDDPPAEIPAFVVLLEDTEGGAEGFEPIFGDVMVRAFNTNGAVEQDESGRSIIRLTGGDTLLNYGAQDGFFSIGIGERVPELATDGGLGSTEAWTTFTALFPDQTSQIWYLDVDRFVGEVAVEWYSADDMIQPQLRIVEGLLDTAFIVNYQPGAANDVTTYGLVLK